MNILFLFFKDYVYFTITLIMLCTELNTLFHLSIYFVGIISRQKTWRLRELQYHNGMIDSCN